MRLIGPKKVVILGGGLSGVSAAYYVTKKFPKCEVTVVERQNRFGGWVNTQKTDFLFEMGPRSIRVGPAATNTVNMIIDLGLEDQIIVADKRWAGRRYILLHNQLRRLPSTLLGVFTSSLTLKAIPSAISEVFVPPKRDGDESIRSFFERRFGAYITSTFVDPLVSGIYAGNASKLSIKSCFHPIWELESNSGSVILGQVSKVFKKVLSRKDNKPESTTNHGIKGIISFKEGLSTLVDALVDRMQSSKQVSLLGSSSVVKIEYNPNSEDKEYPFTIHLSHKNTLKASHILSALPAHALGDILSVSSTTQSLAQALMDIPYVSIATVSLGYSGDILSDNQKGFGFLVPSQEKQNILGITFDSATFPEQNDFDKLAVDPQDKVKSRLCVMIGGDTTNHGHVIDVENATKEQLLNIALQAVKKHLKVEVSPKVSHVFVCKRAIPQYHVGHSALSQKIQDMRYNIFGDRLQIIGSSLDGVSLNDCITTSKKAVDKLES